jgi:hypothetical protein
MRWRVWDGSSAAEVAALRTFPLTLRPSFPPAATYCWTVIANPAQCTNPNPCCSQGLSKFELDVRECRGALVASLFCPRHLLESPSNMAMTAHIWAGVQPAQGT